MKSRRVALYARVSTKGHGQDPETQLLALRDYVQARGWDIAGQYIDIGFSGATDKRPQLDQLMADARRGKFGSVVVCRFDRFARSVRHLVLALEEFRALGIEFVSLSESIDTSTPMGKMVFTVIGAVAELERSLIRERVVLGMNRAKSQGKQIGRPRGSKVDVERLREARGSGLSLSKLASQFETSVPNIVRLLKSGTQ